ncbi:uncharacterized protein TNCV_2819721 [Trichonephila clavipes]|nr:uncharacterized protein TNCV_2819721 [Trichonephila clavipes]
MFENGSLVKDGILHLPTDWGKVSHPITLVRRSHRRNSISFTPKQFRASKTRDSLFPDHLACGQKPFFQNTVTPPKPCRFAPTFHNPPPTLVSDTTVPLKTPHVKELIHVQSVEPQSSPVRGDLGFRYPHDRAGVGRYLSHCSYKAVANSWFLCKQDTVSNKFPPKIKTDRFKLKLRDSRSALAASPPTNKSILTDDEDNNVVIPLAKRSKCYNPPAIHVMSFILAISG